MTSAKINRRVIGDRIGWIDRLIGDINSLPLESYELFIGESRNIWAKVLFSGDAQTLRILAGYRNRLVHFYHEVTTEELYRKGRDLKGNGIRAN